MPRHTLGDEVHVLLACPHHAPICLPVLSTFSSLLTDYALSRPSLTPLQQVSLLLATDPRRHMAGPDRSLWLRDLVPLAASLAIALRDSLASP